MKQWVKYIIFLVGVFSFGLFFYINIYLPKSTFKTIKPTFGDLGVYLRGIGSVGANHIYQVTAQSGGEIEKLYFDEGDWVKKGDLLLSIDGVDLPFVYDEAKIAYKKASLEVESLQSNLASLKSQKSLIELTYNRYKNLIRDGFISQAEYDKAKSDFDVIEAQIKSLHSSISSARSEMDKQQKSIDALAAKLNRLEVYAPVDGYISKREAEVAQYVLPSTTIFKIVDPKTLWVEVNVDERVSTKIEPMQLATIRLRSQPDVLYEGVVKKIGATSNAITLEREIYVAFKQIPKPFYINEQAEVEILSDIYKNVLKIPSKYLINRDGKQGVWIYEDGRALFKSVVILAQNDDEVALEGIDENSEILELEKNKKPIRDGMKIFK